MSQRISIRLLTVGLVLVAATGVSSTGCSDGVPSGRPGKGDKFDEDDIKVTIVKCASRERARAVVKVTANTSPKDRHYFIGLEFLDSHGSVVDSSARELTPQPDSRDDDEISAKVELPMSEPEKASRVTSCKVDHAF
jgi:hypothetical protein